MSPRSGPRAASALMLPVMVPAPGPDADAEFNEWYDSEHAPARAVLPGFLTARRWREEPGWNDGARPDPTSTASDGSLTYVATFDLDDAAALESEEYLRLRETASDHEREVLARCVSRDRRVYAPIPGAASPNAQDLDVCGPLLLIQWWEPDASEDTAPDAVSDRLSAAIATPGVLRVRAFERIDKPAPGRYAVLYDLDGPDALRDPHWLPGTGRDGHRLQTMLFRLWSRLDPSRDD